MSEEQSYIRQFLGYFLRTKSKDKSVSTSVKIMHMINRIAIIMFLIALVIYFYRRLA